MVFYAYFGYPLALLSILSLRHFFPIKGADNVDTQPSRLSFERGIPFVSYIIAAYNEEKRISDKIQNSISQDYPKNKLEIIVASDCSNDKTDEIVMSYASKGIKLVRAPERKGKENAQKHAFDASIGEIIVFSDTATILNPDAITQIVKNFIDPSVGCVSSEDKFIDTEGNITGEGAYVKYEMFLRKLESQFNTLVGLSGSFFAARRDVCENWDIELQSDFNTLLNSIKLGLKGIIDPDSIGFYKNIIDEKKEFDRKVRTILRGITVLMKNLYLINPFRFGVFSWQLFSHKICRWSVPFFLLIAFISNIIVIHTSVFFLFSFSIQVLFYISALIYYSFNTNRPLKKKRYFNNIFQKVFFFLSRISYFFVLANFSIIVAWVKYFMGERKTFWDPSKR